MTAQNQKTTNYDPESFDAGYQKALDDLAFAHAIVLRNASASLAPTSNGKG